MKEFNIKDLGIESFLERIREVYYPKSKSCVVEVDQDHTYNDEGYDPAIIDIYFYDDNNNKLNPDYKCAAKFNWQHGFAYEAYDNDYALCEMIAEINEKYEYLESDKLETIKVNF